MSYSPPQTNRVTVAPNMATGQQVRLWAGQVLSNTSGAWTLDISSANFNHVVSVVATAQANQTSVTSIPVATIRNYSTTIVTGWVLRSSQGMIVLGGSYSGATFSNTATNVFVQVVGY